MSDIRRDILDIGQLLKGRMEDWRIKFAMDYVEYNEITIAFENICTYIYEDYIRITNSEYKAIDRVDTILEGVLSYEEKTELRKLIIDNIPECGALSTK